MSYSEWTQISSAYQAYTAASTRCTDVYRLRALNAKIRDCHRRESELWRPLEKMARRRIRRQREITEEQAAKLRRRLRTPEQVEADASAERAAQEREIAEAHAAIMSTVRMASEPQLRLIVRLEKQRLCSGDDSGFQSVHPSTREELARMTFEQASQRIDSLKGEY